MADTSLVLNDVSRARMRAGPRESYNKFFRGPEEITNEIASLSCRRKFSKLHAKQQEEKKNSNGNGIEDARGGIDYFSGSGNFGYAN